MRDAKYEQHTTSKKLYSADNDCWQIKSLVAMNSTYAEPFVVQFVSRI